jgi:hypothetical protein
MMNFQKQCECDERAASDRTQELVQAAARLSRFHRVSWKEALGQIVSPAMRLHRYRNIHNRLLQTALCKLDSRDAGDRCS